MRQVFYGSAPGSALGSALGSDPEPARTGQDGLLRVQKLSSRPVSLHFLDIFL